MHAGVGPQLTRPSAGSLVLARPFPACGALVRLVSSRKPGPGGPGSDLTRPGGRVGRPAEQLRLDLVNEGPIARSKACFSS